MIKFVEMRLLIYFACLLFTFVSVGGNIYLHKCKDATLLSFYDKVDTKSCPFCEKHHKSSHEKDNHCDGECSDSVLKIDQLSDKNLNSNQISITKIAPAIVPILWIVNFIIPTHDTNNTQNIEYIYSCADSSPPIYIQNCIFII